MADLKTFAPIRIVFESNLPVHIRIWIYSSIQENSINVVNTAAQKPITCMNLRVNPSLHTLFYSVFASFTFMSINVTIGAETEENVLLSHRIKKYPDFTVKTYPDFYVFKNVNSGEQIQKVADLHAGLTGYTHTHTLLFALLFLHYIHVSFLGIWQYLFYLMIFFLCTRYL